MSKPNYRREIKEKEELQAQFQLAIASANSTVLSWLKPSYGDHSAQAVHQESSAQAESFLNLPVISAGCGLSLSQDDGNRDENDIHTIGDFINGNQKVSSLSKKKKKQHTLADKLSRINDRHRIQKTDSRATVALKNKMRNMNRVKVRNVVKSETRKPSSGNEESDDDDEEEDIRRERSVKKGSNLLFDARLKKKSTI